MAASAINKEFQRTYFNLNCPLVITGNNLPIAKFYLTFLTPFLFFWKHFTKKSRSILNGFGNIVANCLFNICLCCSYSCNWHAIRRTTYIVHANTIAEHYG